MKRVAVATVIFSAVALLTRAQPAATIRGRVVADDTGDPIANARVSLIAPSTNSLETPVVLSDGDGRFTLPAPAGRYGVVASKSGYARHEITSATIGQAVEIRLLRGAVITGHVVDEFGDPVLFTPVFVESSPPSTANRRAVAATNTDDRGEYRLGGLPAGAVVVAVENMRAIVMTPQLARMPPEKTYFPGTATRAEAQELRLQPGSEQAGIDFVVPAAPIPLPPVALARQLAGLPELNPATATGIIRGRITTTDGRALSRAEVRLVAPDRLPRGVNADADGRFEFRDLPAGKFRVMASKVGYAVGVSGDPATPFFDLADGQTRERVDLALSRYGTLEGRVFDELGDPLEGANVQVLHVRYEAGRRRLVPASTASRLTDDLGRYRLFGLAPGQYIVSAVVGGVASADLPGYARAYFPGTPNPGQAQFVTVGVSQDVAGIDLSLSRTRTVRITGKALDAAGNPAGGSLTLVPSQRSTSVTSVAAGARILPDGRFEFPNVTPGQYLIQANRGRLRPSMEGEFGAIPVSVTDTDVTGLLLQTTPGSSIAGRFTFESTDLLRRPASSALELTPIPVDFDLSPLNNWASADIHDDWTFEMAGINGPRRLQLVRTPPDWALKEIRVNRIDVTDRRLSFGKKEQSLTDVEVVLTDRVSEVAGTVAISRDSGASNLNVIVFSTDRDKWYFASRFVRKTMVGAGGAFTLAGLPFGSYYAAAVDARPAEGGDGWQDPAFLESLLPRASTVTVREGQKVSINLELKF